MMWPDKFFTKLLNTILRNIKNSKAVVPKIDIQDAVKQKINSENFMSIYWPKIEIIYFFYKHLKHLILVKFIIYIK